MDVFTPIDKERYEHVEQIVEAMWDRLVRRAIDAILDLPESCRLSGDDMRLSSFWEEYKYQMQREESVSIDLYNETVELVCGGVVDDLDREQRGLLWLWTDGYYRWADEGGGIPYGDPVDEGLARELYDRVRSAACDEELAHDPDVERERAMYEEDMERNMGGIEQDLARSLPDADSAPEGHAGATR